MTNNPASREELWDIIRALDQRVTNLEERRALDQENIGALNTENSGWLKIYQRQQSEIDELKASISRLESRIRAPRAEP